MVDTPSTADAAQTIMEGISNVALANAVTWEVRASRARRELARRLKAVQDQTEPGQPISIDHRDLALAIVFLDPDL